MKQPYQGKRKKEKGKIREANSFHDTEDRSSAFLLFPFPFFLLFPALLLATVASTAAFGLDEPDDPPEADVAALERAAAANPRDIPAAISLAKAYRKLNRFDKAEALYRLILVSDSGADDAQRAEACNGIGFIREKQREYGEAIKQYERALEHRPFWERPLVHIGSCLMEQGDNAGAEHSLREAFRVAPNDASVRNAMGVLFSRTGRPEAAEREYSAAVRLRPGWIPPQWNLVLLLDQQGRYRESDRHLDAILKAEPGHPDARYVRVQHLVGAREYGLAEREARALMADHPGRAESHEALGLALWSKEDVEGAEAQFRKALEIDSNSAGAYLGLGHVRMEQRRFSEAEEYYRLAAELEPSAADAKQGYAQAARAEQRERFGGGCTAAPRFTGSPAVSSLQCLAVILPVVLLRRRV